MGLVSIAALSLMAMATPPPAPTVAHQLRVEHRGAAHDVTYRGTVDVAHRQIGMASALGRPGSQRCLWTGTVAVERHVARPDGTAFPARPIARDEVLTGSRPGDCRANATAIHREVAARQDAVRAHVVAVAERDHPEMRAELDHVGRLAAN
jgi:hypothetical protein